MKRESIELGGAHGNARARYPVCAEELAEGAGFAAVAVITLALGIGASTAIFSVIENVLMEPFPYPDAQRFMSVQIHERNGASPGAGGFSGPEFLDYVEQNHVLTG